MALKTPPYFNLSTGELDSLCFESDENNSTLSRLGAVRLLDSIDAQCPEFNLCKNWNKVKKVSITGNNVNKTTQTSSRQPPPQRSLPVLQPPSHRSTPSTTPNPPPGPYVHGGVPHRFHAGRDHGRREHLTPASLSNTVSSPTPDASWGHHVQERTMTSHNTPPGWYGGERSQPDSSYVTCTSLYISKLASSCHSPESSRAGEGHGRPQQSYMATW